MDRRGFRERFERVAGSAIDWSWRHVVWLGTVRSSHRRARAFAHFGEGASIAFPPAALYGEARIEIGAQTIVGPNATLSAGMPVPLDTGHDPIVTIGKRCVLGKGVSIVGHERIEIGDDTCTGPNVYITDQNHGYEDLEQPISTQLWKNAPVRVGPECWLGNGAVVLPGAVIGRHVVVAAGAVVSGTVPDYCVVAGVPARIVRRHRLGRGWVRTTPGGEPLPEPTDRA